NIHLLGWRDDLDHLIDLAEVVWSPSLIDDVPLVLLEALAAGKPVVASQQPSVTEFVNAGETALLHRPGDQPALAKQTRRLLEQPEFAREMGRRAGLSIRRTFTTERWTDRHLEAYELAA